MSRIFLSHSSANSAEAVALRDWLVDAGWDDIFLDLDPERGIVAGERWARALNQAVNRCEAVLFVVSRQWLASDWCRKEFTLAHRLNKKLFGLLIEDIDVADIPKDLAGEWQLVRLAAGRDHVMLRAVLPVTHEEVHVTFSAEALKRLRIGLERSGLASKHFAWPPEHDPMRAPYRGLSPLDHDDAGIFFGRDGSIVEALDRVRGLKDAAPPRILVILGASGAGKSSFMRAGLLPRMARDDRNFHPLPVVRPESAALTHPTSGLIACLETALRSAGLARKRSDIRTAVESGAATVAVMLKELAAEVAAPDPEHDGANLPPPVLVLPIDQGEELFLAGSTAEAEVFLDLLRGLIGADEPAFMALFTIRSDNYEHLQTARALEGITQQFISLPPMLRGAYAQVISGPAARLESSGRSLVIEPELVEALLCDIEEGGAKDALPLLAFSLERLYAEHGGDGRLTLSDYEHLGRVRGSIEAAVSRALQAADANPAIPGDENARLALLRRGLIPWLAGVDPDTGTPRRRIAKHSDVPEEARPLIDLLVEQRLLSTDLDPQTGDRTIEPAHEALLRQWGRLGDWLEEDLGALTTLEGVKRAARDWLANDKRASWLSHSGSRLDEAEQVAARLEFDRFVRPDDQDYLAACRTRQKARTDRERFLNRATRAAAVIALIGAGVAAWQWREATSNAEIADRQRISAETTKSLLLSDLTRQHVANGDDITGMMLALEALPSAHDAVERPWVIEANRSLADALYSRREATVLFDVSGETAESAGTAYRDRQARTGQFRVGPLASLAMSGDETLLVTGGRDGVVRFWDAGTGKVVRQLRGHEANVYSVAMSRDSALVASGSEDRTARIWDAATGALMQVLVGHDARINSVGFNDDATVLATGSDDATVRLWDVANGKLIRVVEGHSKPVYAVAFSRDGSLLASGAEDHTAQIWDAATGERIVHLTGHENAVTSAAFNADGTHIITGSWDNTARIWDVQSGLLQQTLAAHADSVYAVAYSPDGRSILTASKDETVLVWDVSNGAVARQLRGYGSRVVTALFSADNRHIVAALHDGAVWSRDHVDPAEVLVLAGHTGWVRSASFSPDGRYVLSGSNDRTIRLWDTVTGRQVSMLEGHGDQVRSVGFSANGEVIVSGSNDGTARMWSVATGRQISQPLSHEDIVIASALSPDGSRVATSSVHGALRVWSTATGIDPVSFSGHHDEIWSVAFSPDGTRLVSAAWDNSARIWDIETGEVVHVLKGHAGRVSSAAFSPDGRYVVTGSHDRTARLWEAATGKEVRVFSGHGNWIWSAVFSPDGGRIATGSKDGSARIWDIESGEEIVMLAGHRDEIWSVAFNPQGNRLVTASTDRTLRVWNVPFKQAEDVAAYARSVVPRCLDNAQRRKYFLDALPRADADPLYCKK